MIAIDLREQQAINPDPKAMQQKNWTENLDRPRNTKIYFIIEELEEIIQDFLERTVRVL